MRSTVTLDPDVEVLVQSAMRETGASFKQVLNDALRRGLGSRTSHPAPRFKPMTFDMGSLLVTSTSLNALAAELEDREQVAKMAALALEHGAVVGTSDRDFIRLDGVKVDRLELD